MWVNPQCFQNGYCRYGYGFYVWHTVTHRIPVPRCRGYLLYPGIRNSIINISFDLRLWFHTISHDYLPVLSDLVQLRTLDICPPDRLLFYLTAIMPPRTYIAFALIFIYSELQDSGTLNSVGFVTGNPRVGKCHTVPVPAVPVLEAPQVYPHLF